MIKPLAVISGASSGIGLETAKLLGANGYDLILLARREVRIKNLALEINKASPSCSVKYFTLDVRDVKAIQNLVASQAELFSRVQVLVNSAGLARGTDKMQNAQVSDWDDMISTNVNGLLYLTRSILPFMLKNNLGDIVNIGSVAGRWVYPGGGVYCATKFAVRALSEGLRLDLMGSPIRVMNIEPGMVETEFSEVRTGDTKLAKKIYSGMTPLTAMDIAESILWSLSRPKHVNIQELVIFPTDQAAVGQVQRR